MAWTAADEELEMQELAGVLVYDICFREDSLAKGETNGRRPRRGRWLELAEHRQMTTGQNAANGSLEHIRAVEQ